MKKTFSARLQERLDELKQLYLELYPGEETAFVYFLNVLKEGYAQRKKELRERDRERIADPDWYRSRKMLGMMLYVDRFTGTLRGLEEKLPYLQECGINYLHLMPLLATTYGKSDGGYAVADFRSVQQELGTMADLEHLADICHEKGISLCLDFVMNHTSEDHPWARAARAGDPLARSRYFFFDNWDIPNEYEKTMPEVFPTTAPGNFTWYDDCRQVVMTTFYPYQWDLNYANPIVMNDMTENLLYLANRGMDVLRLDAIPYIWKELGTKCRNLPQVHTISRILHLVCETVCPGVLLLGEVVMEPSEVNVYFGSQEAPECHMLYNVTTMCTIWHTLATQDARLLRRQLDVVCGLPGNGVFQNYLRCHDDIGWGLDYPFLLRFGMGEVTHKQFLNDWYTGRLPGSWSRGELYNDDWRLGDARLCGTTASLTGLEAASNEAETETALQRDVMLHAFMMSLSGIPVLYSGDEIAQLNDYSYHEDPEKLYDSRYLHRGVFPWERAALRKDENTVPGRLFAQLRRIETVRASSDAFHADAHVHTFDTDDDAVIGFYREYEGCGLVCYYNFASSAKTAWLPEGTDLLSGERTKEGRQPLPAYAFRWIEVSHGEE